MGQPEEAGRMYDDGERAEQLFRIEAMKGELQDIAEGQCVFGEMNGDISPDIEEQFLQHVLAYESAEDGEACRLAGARRRGIARSG